MDLFHTEAEKFFQLRSLNVFFFRLETYYQMRNISYL